FAQLRSNVLGEVSQLNSRQQHQVLIFSIRDLRLKNLQASAKWLLEISEDYLPQMLPAEATMLHLEHANLLALNAQAPAAKAQLQQVKNLVQKHSPLGLTHAAIAQIDSLQADQSANPRPISGAKKTLLTEFLNRYSALARAQPLSN
ncbi:MAG: hypothetical protein ACPGSC_06060, partial [Granulosicoccaceae bacterium]